MSLHNSDWDLIADRLAPRLAELLNREARRLIDRNELAERLAISPRGVTALVSRGELPRGHLIGGVRRWDWAQVLKYLAGRRERQPRCGRGRYKRS
jgi:hypothetical protein